MFEQLVESRPARARSGAQLFLSMVVHTVLIAVSIQLTRAVAETVVKHPVTLEPLHIARRSAPPVAHSATAATTTVAAPVVAPLVAVPLVVPNAIPAPELSRRYDTSRLTGPVGNPFDVGSDSHSSPGDSLLVATAEQVDEPVAYLDGPPPAYPPALRSVGIEGAVTLRYVVGTDGRVEPESVEVLRTTNHAFDAPAIAAIKGARFRAAMRRGRVVRQLVEQVVRFTINRG